MKTGKLKAVILCSLILIMSLFVMVGCQSTETQETDTSTSEVTSTENSASVDTETQQDTVTAEEEEVTSVDTETQEPVEIQVFIAASLSEAMEKIKEDYALLYPNVTITYNADSSGTLATQIMEGYSCDLFFSAAESQMNTLEDEGLVIDGTRVSLLSNQIVLISAKGSNTQVTGFDNIDLASSMALADGSVPAGKYSRIVLMNLGILGETDDPASITTQEVSDALGGLEINECSNVSKVKEAVKEGSNEVGTVYYSDAYSVKDDVDIIAYADEELSGPIVYPAALISNVDADEAETAAAAEFLSYLQTDEAKSVFEEFMFQLYE